MKFTLVVALLLAVVAVVAADVRVTSGIAKIGAVNTVPNTPVPGQNFQVTVQGLLTQDLPHGVTAVVSVKFSGIEVFKRTQTFGSALQAGSFSKTVTHQFPAVIPKGEYVATVVINAGDKLVAEVEFDLKEGVSVSKLVDADLVLINDEEMINALNTSGGWVAGHNARFDGMSVADAKSLLGSVGATTEGVTPLILHSAVQADDSFDARTKWPKCIHPIRDQQQCGSCWAFGATEALSDRFCIASDGATDVVLSPQDLVSCDTNNYGCQGGYLNLTWVYLQSKGTVADKDFPYSSGSGIAPPCSQEKAGAKRYKSKDVLHPTGVASIQTLIETSGPVEAGFSVYQDFFNYKSGVYYHKTGGLAGGHAIKILGWGVDDASKLPYWIVANSWGTAWGNQGFFWIKKGTDECGIEDQIYAGTPAL